MRMVLLLLPWWPLLLFLQCLSFARFPFHGSQVYVGLKPVLKFFQEAPGPLLSIYFWLKPLLKFFQEPPRAVQEHFCWLLEPTWTKKGDINKPL